VAAFKIAENYGKHRVGGRSYVPGEAIELDRYDPKWAFKFEPQDETARQLQHVAMTLQRKVWERDLQDASAEAGVVEAQQERRQALEQAIEPAELASDQPAKAAEVEAPKAPKAPSPRPGMPLRGPGKR